MNRNIAYSSLSKGLPIVLPERQVASSFVTPPPLALQDSSAWNSSPLETNMDIFDFTTATAVPPIPSFAPANANTMTDMTFLQSSASRPHRNPSQSGLSQSSKESHDAKRIKVESPPAALDSIDSWLRFDDDAEQFGSFEIDYSKNYRPTSQNRPTTDWTPGLGSGLYANPTAPFREEDFLDDSAFDHSLSEDEDIFESMNLDEQLSKIDTMPPPEPPSQRSLYSTPLSWDKPQPGIHPSAVTMSNEIPRRMGGNTSWDTIPQDTTNYVLSADERRRLIEIAMGPNRIPTYVSPSRFNLGYGPGMQSSSQTKEFSIGGDTKQGLSHVEMDRRHTSADTSTSGISPQNQDLKHKQPKNEAPPPKSAPSKRPNSQSGPGAKEKQRSADRIAHNDVERKYRTNLKDKITELRNAVPALQQVAEADGQDESQGVAKVSKGTVLTKATEYIHHLEQRNKDIMTEHRQLIRRLQAFETLLNSSMRGTEAMPSHSMALFDPRGFC